MTPEHPFRRACSEEANGAAEATAFESVAHDCIRLARAPGTNGPSKSARLGKRHPANRRHLLPQSQRRLVRWYRLDQVRRAGIALAETTMADSDTHRVHIDRESDRAAQASTFMTCHCILHSSLPWLAASNALGGIGEPIRATGVQTASVLVCTLPACIPDDVPCSRALEGACDAGVVRRGLSRGLRMNHVDAPLSDLQSIVRRSHFLAPQSAILPSLLRLTMSMVCVGLDSSR
jgi:hypothetical protein